MKIIRVMMPLITTLNNRCAFLIVVLFFLLDSSYSQDKAVNVLPDTGISRSSTRQFIVHGDDSVARGAMCVFCERTKSELLSLLKLRDRWRYPLVIQIRGDLRDINTGSPIKPNIFKLPDDKFRFQIDINLGDKFKAHLLKEELVKLLVAELIIKSGKRVVTANKNGVIPDWIRIGLAEVLSYEGRKLNDGSLSKFLRKGKVLSLKEIVVSDIGKMDSISEGVYRTSCGALVYALLSQDDGASRLQKYLLDFNSGDEKSLDSVKRFFTNNGSANESLEDWWVMECARMAEPNATEILSPIETEKELVECLKIKIVSAKNKNISNKNKKNLGDTIKYFFKKPKNQDVESLEDLNEGKSEYEFLIYDINDYKEIVRKDDKSISVERSLKINESKLLKLSYRAFPLFRPIIQEYQKILINISTGKIKGVDQRLKDLQYIRSSMIKSTNQARDYLNWFEATQIKNRSDNFQNYQKTYNELSRPLPPRKDKLSEYLDELDKEFKR
tara:strand:+ start:10756 stop:12255 length:1500 start_codon:yes stop_codon:yes gene_type:complete